MRFDLHIHSCLSPCGDLGSSPAAIVDKAREEGLDGIMLADHNTSRNCPALADACHRKGNLSCLFGMEVTSAEEVHCLAVFDTPEQAASMTETVYAKLPKRVNQPEIFGDQPVVDADENVIELEWRILAMPTRMPIKEIGECVHALGGLFIAAHIDRSAFSVTSQLGGLAGDEGFDAVELTRFAKLEEWVPVKTLGLPVIRSSDAHFLENIGDVWTEADLPSFSVAGLKEVFSRGSLGYGKR